MYISNKIYDRQANLASWYREASWLVRTESGLKENVLDINNIET